MDGDSAVGSSAPRGQLFGVARARAVDAGLGSAFLVLAVLSKNHRGIAQELVTGQLGDVFFVAAVYFALRAAVRRLRRPTAAAIVLGAACTVELLQGVGVLHREVHDTLGYWLGQHFDVRDFAAYGVGTLVALLLDRRREQMVG